MKVLVVLLLAAACAPMPVAETGSSASGRCDAAVVQDLVGKRAATVSVEAQRRSRAASVRTYKTGDPVTMDYREDRLNVETDAGGAIVKLSCG